MKIKKFKIVPRIREVYNNLRRNNICITSEIETMVTIVDKKIAEVVLPSVLFETFEIEDKRIEKIKSKIENIPKNVSLITFILVTLGEKVENISVTEDKEIEKIVVESLLLEYLDAALRFTYKILQQQLEEKQELSSIFTLPCEVYPELFCLIDPAKIGLRYENSLLVPKFSSINYLFWFKKK